MFQGLSSGVIVIKCDISRGKHKLRLSLFKVLDRELVRPYEKGGKYRYRCSEAECDAWATLFGYDENNKWRFKIPSDSVHLDLKDISITLGDLRNGSAWEEFINRLDIEHRGVEYFSVKHLNSEGKLLFCRYHERTKIRY